MEQERNEAKQKVLSYADETISNLNRLHSQYIWETLEKFFSLLETCGGVFQKENMFLSEEMEKDMKSMKETLVNIPFFPIYSFSHIFVQGNS